MRHQKTSSQRQERLDQFLAKLQMGDFAGAVTLGTKLVNKSKNDASLLNYLGIAHAQLGQFERAAQRFTLASRIQPGFAWAHNNLGSALRNLGKLDEAATAIEAALAIQDDYAEAHNNLGNVMADQENFDAAINCYQAAIAADREYARAHINLCEVLEKTNQLEAFGEAVQVAKLHCPANDPRLLLHLGKLAVREKDYVTSRDHLLKIDLNSNPSEITIPACEQLGKSYDKLGDYDAAFASFANMNRRTIDLLAAADRGLNGYLQAITSMSAAWQSQTCQAKPAPPTSQKIAFLIGFPRSGTTLLDTVLRGHPDITVVEEQPILDDLISRFRIDETPSSLAQLTDEQILELRAFYLDQINTLIGSDPAGQLLVDKFPLNLRHVGLVQRLFPDAKIIFALRDPADCVLSCFMQNFTLNTAMASFLSLEQAGKTYDAVMELWTHYEPHLTIGTHFIKYEDLITDLPGTMKPLLRFLGLEWVDSMSEHQKTAQQRTNINTPSYDQVTQPLYTQAMQRWRRYERHLAPILPITKKWATYWNYPA